jgi:hypothetical protein
MSAAAVPFPDRFRARVVITEQIAPSGRAWIFDLVDPRGACIVYIAYSLDEVLIASAEWLFDGVAVSILEAGHS